MYRANISIYSSQSDSITFNENISKLLKLSFSYNLSFFKATITTVKWVFNLNLTKISHDLSGYMHSRKCGITRFCYLDGYRQVTLALDWLSCTMNGTTFNSHIYKMVHLWNNCTTDLSYILYNYISVAYILKNIKTS